MRTFVLAAGIAALAVPAFSGGTYDSSGVGYGTSQNEVTPIADGHMVMSSATTWDTMDMANADHPFQGMSGKCFGAVEVKVPNAAGSGHCVFTDGDGDQNVNRWVATGLGADGALQGSWTVVGGTGKFAGASGGGMFSSLTDQATGKFENTITGALTLK